jgi:type 1 glutamine amidotransferase
MKNLFALFLISLGAVSQAAEPAKLRVAILDGQNNHNWQATTPILKKHLESASLFTVEVITTPARGKKEEMANFKPDFSTFDVLVSNYNGETWPAEVRTAFETYVRNGGGFVSYHAADNAFPDWPEYNVMIGVGGWGGRNEKSGPYLRLRTQGWIKDLTAGPGGGHGPQHEFLVESRADHPIVRGLPAKWLHAKDELYHGLRGPAENVTVVASAMSAATKENEPVLMTIPYGKGRVFHTTLGHGVEAVNGLGFQLTFARGTEWVATGAVTLPAPKAGDLPADRAAVRPVK